MPLHEVNVPALDRGFLFGDAIYEVVRIYEGRAWRMLDHMERLAGNLFKLSIPYPVDLVERRINETLAASALAEALVYIQITRGCAPRHHYYPEKPEPNCLIWIQPFDDGFKKFRESGASAITYDDIRWSRNDIKCTSLAANCAAANAAHQQHCVEAIFINRDGYLSEGSHSSIFAVREGRLIVTPTSSAVLPGITKMLLIELCRLVNVPMEEGRVRKDHLCLEATAAASQTELGCVEEVFLTSTPEEIIPIIRIDGNPVGRGEPGPVTRKLQHAYSRAIRDWLAAE